jgi:hypothetical protein
MDSRAQGIEWLGLDGGKTITLFDTFCVSVPQFEKFNF